jgi:hypothetical protein
MSEGHPPKLEAEHLRLITKASYRGILISRKHEAEEMVSNAVIQLKYRRSPNVNVNEKTEALKLLELEGSSWPSTLGMQLPTTIIIG